MISKKIGSFLEYLFPSSLVHTMSKIKSEILRPCKLVSLSMMLNYKVQQQTKRSQQ